MSVVEMTVSASESLKWGRRFIPRLQKKSLFVSSQTYFDLEEIYLDSLKKRDLVAWLNTAMDHEQVLHICSVISTLQKTKKDLEIDYYIYLKARHMCRRYYQEFLLSQSSEQLTAIIEPPTTLFRLGELLDKRRTKVWLEIAKTTQEIDILVEIHERTSCMRAKNIAFKKLSKVI